MTVRHFPGRSHRRKLAVALGLIALPPLGHGLLGFATRVEPPAIEVPPPGASHAWTRVRAGVREVYLDGSPEEIGAAHARLVAPQMQEVERQLWGDFERYVPLWLARVGIQDWSRVRYRHVDQWIPEPRRRELAAQSLSLDPDPFASRLPTYQRLLFLHALYDIALSLEHSPLIGCTSFAIAPAMTRDGHVLAARAFDFEAGDVFDREKAVFFVRENGAIPFASVAWPGLVGVVTGLNAEGVFLAVHGGRAGQPSAHGIPVTFAVREALAHAHDTGDAVAILRAQDVMISHIVFVADAQGRFAVVERAPETPAFVRTSSGNIAITNHFEGPLASDPKNLRVRETTSTIARRLRADELLANIEPHAAGPETALSILRDHGCATGPGRDEPCALGDRRAIDAFIATHGVIADTTARVLWVSAGPHLSGHFVRLDLTQLLAPSHLEHPDPEPELLPAEQPALSPRRSQR